MYILTDRLDSEQLLRTNEDIQQVESLIVWMGNYPLDLALLWTRPLLSRHWFCNCFSISGRFSVILAYLILIGHFFCDVASGSITPPMLFVQRCVRFICVWFSSCCSQHGFIQSICRVRLWLIQCCWILDGSTKKFGFWVRTNGRIVEC
jgi:hypothetical protein